MIDHAQLVFLSKAFIALLAIANPLAAVPLLLTMTRGDSRELRRKAARRCALAIAVILVSSAWIGVYILQGFGIGIPAFRAGGGILIILMALAMLHAKTSSAKQTPDELVAALEKEDIAIVPLATPLIVGPGAISLTISLAQQSPQMSEKLMLTGVLIAVTAVIWLVLHLSGAIARVLGPTGLNISTRIMGMLLIAIGVQMVAEGAKALLPGLAS